eukprot:COSAG01_NODE_24371_length_781_cov_1.590909_2_plen_73_part_00
MPQPLRARWPRSHEQTGAPNHLGQFFFTNVLGGVVAQRARAEDLEAQNRLLRADVARQSTQVSLRIKIDYQD